MPPGDGFLLFSELQKSRQSFVLETDLHAIYLVTPISICYQMQDIDWMCFLDMWEKLPASKRRVGELVGVKEAFFVKAVRGHKLDFKALQIHKRFYTSLALEELVCETHVTEVAQKFKCSRGLLQSLQQMASTFAGTVTSFCQALNWTMLANIISQFKERLFFGVHHDLVDLMKIPNLNNQRARSLFNEGIQNLADLANSDVFTIEKILYNSICFDTKQRDGENNWDAEQRNKLRYLFVTGKSGLTIRESAVEMIESARQCLELEMGVENIVWSKHSQKLEEANSQNILSNGVSSQGSANSQQNHRKRKLRDDKSTSPERQQLSKKQRGESPQIVIETESEMFGDECIQRNSEEFNMETDDRNEFVEEIPKCEELNIVNVFESLEFFNQLQTAIKSSSVVSVSVGVNQILQTPQIIGLGTMVNQRKSETDNTESCNCRFGDNKFIAGISLCLCDSAVYYLNLQSEAKDDSAISFDMKIKFLVELFHMKQLTLDMYDAKEQCKVLVKCIPQLSTLSVQLRDPLIANWLLQPDVDRNLFTMVRKYAPACGRIVQMVGIDKWKSGSISLNCDIAVSPKI
ncbi:DNA polymerase theta, partial [Pseudolycoriella hygida]